MGATVEELQDMMIELMTRLDTIERTMTTDDGDAPDVPTERPWDGFLYWAASLHGALPDGVTHFIEAREAIADYLLSLVEIFPEAEGVIEGLCSDLFSFEGDGPKWNWRAYSSRLVIHPTPVFSMDSWT